MVRGRRGQGVLRRPTIVREPPRDIPVLWLQTSAHTHCCTIALRALASFGNLTSTLQQNSSSLRSRSHALVSGWLMHGPRERRDEIVKWVTKHSGPPVQTLRRMAEFQKAKKQNVYVVAFFDEFEVGDTAETERRAQSCRRKQLCSCSKTYAN